MQENYLAKWLNNDLTEEELKEFKNSEEYASYMRILRTSAELEAPEFDVDMAWNDLRARREDRETKVVVMRPMQKLMRIAAAVAVLFMISYFYFNSLDETIKTEYAQRQTVILLTDAQGITSQARNASTASRNTQRTRPHATDAENSLFAIS